MNKILKLTDEELEIAIKNTADKMGLSKAIVEKDLWVFVILQYLFTKFKFKDKIVFKGGTSLSKVYNLIERFSEDIDIALNWKVLGYEETEPWLDRSNTKQLKFNEKLNEDTAVFLRNEFLPVLQKDFKEILKNKAFSFEIDETDKNTICFAYPNNHKDNSILQVIRLEIGCLAEPVPASRQKIKSYIQEIYSDNLGEDIEVVAVSFLRTFFEKITILHREANRVNGNYPRRYSRHYYDVFRMIKTEIREMSLKNLGLLKAVINFKKKFYTCNWAKYEEILSGNLKLVPPQPGLDEFQKDYLQMQTMLFGKKVSFAEIIDEIQKYETEINTAIKKYFLVDK